MVKTGNTAKSMRKLVKISNNNIRIQIMMERKVLEILMVIRNFLVRCLDARVEVDQQVIKDKMLMQV